MDRNRRQYTILLFRRYFFITVVDYKINKKYRKTGSNKGNWKFVFTIAKISQFDGYDIFLTKVSFIVNIAETFLFIKFAIILKYIISHETKYSVLRIIMITSRKNR